MYTVHIVSWVEYYEYSTLTIVEDNFYKAMRHYRDAVKDKDVVRVTLETPTMGSLIRLYLPSDHRLSQLELLSPKKALDKLPCLRHLAFTIGSMALLPV